MKMKRSRTFYMWTGVLMSLSATILNAPFLFAVGVGITVGNFVKSVFIRRKHLWDLFKVKKNKLIFIKRKIPYPLIYIMFIGFCSNTLSISFSGFVALLIILLIFFKEKILEARKSIKKDKEENYDIV
tara:strand:+ start:202 stop:585 length:384 start_codon:yes stop_codon:yes gene_type:complete